MTIASVICRAQFAVLLALYFWLGLAQLPQTVNESINDLLLHAVGYCVAVFSAYLLLQHLSKMWLALAGLWLFSLLVEVVQYYLPWRSFSALDLMANGSGLLLGFILVAALRPLLNKIIALFRLTLANSERAE